MVAKDGSEVLTIPTLPQLNSDPTGFVSWTTKMKKYAHVFDNPRVVFQIHVLMISMMILCQ